MKQTYNVGYVKTPSVQHLSDTKKALVDNGIVSQITPNELLPKAIDENLTNLKPENIKNNIKIGNVKGEFVGDSIELLENLDPNQCEQQLNLNKFDHIYFAKNGKDAYAAYASVTFDSATQVQKEAGIFHINLETNVITKVYASGYYWKYFTEGNNNDVYVSSATSSYLGLIRLNGDQPAYMVYSSGYEWSKSAVDDEGNIYLLTSTSSTGSSYGILYISRNGVCIKIQNSEQTQKFKIVKDKQGNIYIAENSSSNTTNFNYPSGVIRLKNGNMIQVAVDPTDARKHFFLILANGVAYASSLNVPLSIVSEDSLIPIPEAKIASYSVKILDEDNYYLIISTQIIHVHADQHTVIPVPDGVSLYTSMTYAHAMYINGVPSLLIGDNSGNIYQIIGTDFKKVYTESKMTSNIALSAYNSIYVSTNSDVYLGTNGAYSSLSGIVRIRDGVGTVIAPVDKLPAGSMYYKSVGHVDPDGNVYIKYIGSGSTNLSTTAVYPITIVSPDGEISYSSKVPEYYNTFIDAPGGGVYHSYGSGVNPDLPLYLLKDGMTYTLQVPLKKE